MFKGIERVQGLEQHRGLRINNLKVSRIRNV